MRLQATSKTKIGSGENLARKMTGRQMTRKTLETQKLRTTFSDLHTLVHGGTSLLALVPASERDRFGKVCQLDISLATMPMAGGVSQTC